MKTTGLIGTIVAALVAIAALAGVYDARTYANDALAWRTQAVAQDAVNLAVVVPWLLACSTLVRWGSISARYALVGALGYLAYTYAIAAFDVQFNTLFLVYVAILGLSAWTMFGVLRARIPRASEVGALIPRRITGSALIAIAILFGFAWIGSDVEALLRGEPSAELAASGLPTNPVHVLDLAFALPALSYVGIALLRDRRGSRALAIAAVTFVVLMAIAVAAMVIAQHGAREVGA